MRGKLTAIHHQTLADQIRRITQQRSPKKHPAEIARGLVTLEYALHTSGCRRTEFARRFVDGPGRSKSALLFKWLSGETVPSRQKILQVDRSIPGTLSLYEHPIFDLLANLPIPLGEIEDCLAPFAWDAPFDEKGWRFHTHYQTEKPAQVFVRNDTAALRDSHDINGIAILLGLVREAEAVGRTINHMTYMAEVYRSLPALLSIPWFRPHRDLVCWCMQRVHARDPLSFHMLSVNWDSIRRLEQPDVQSRMLDPQFRSLLWRSLERADIDVVEFARLPRPSTLPKPLPSVEASFVEPPTPKPAKRRRTAEDIEQRLRAVIDEYDARFGRKQKSIDLAVLKDRSRARD